MLKGESAGAFVLHSTVALLAQKGESGLVRFCYSAIAGAGRLEGPRINMLAWQP